GRGPLAPQTVTRGEYDVDALSGELAADFETDAFVRPGHHGNALGHFRLPSMQIVFPLGQQLLNYVSHFAQMRVESQRRLEHEQCCLPVARAQADLTQPAK